MGKAYDTVKRIADGLGWPVHFPRDLNVHDRNFLKGCDGEFLWAVSTYGTHAERADHLCEIAKGQGGFGFGTHHGSSWRTIVGKRLHGDERSFLCTPDRCAEITGHPEKVGDIMRRWLKDCRAAEYRKREVLEGLRRRRR